MSTAIVGAIDSVTRINETTNEQNAILSYLEDPGLRGMIERIVRHYILGSGQRNQVIIMVIMMTILVSNLDDNEEDRVVVVNFHDLIYQHRRLFVIKCSNNNNELKQMTRLLCLKLNKQHTCDSMVCNKIMNHNQVCKDCKSAFYCSKKCQKYDWKVRHRKICVSKFIKPSSQTQKYGVLQRECMLHELVNNDDLIYATVMLQKQDSRDVLSK